MGLNLFLFWLIILACLSVNAQKKTLQIKGSLIYTLGTDTSLIGNFELNGNQFQMTVVSMSQDLDVSKLQGAFSHNGELQHLEGYNYGAAKGIDSLNYSFQLQYERDTSVIRITRGNSCTIHKYPVRVMVANPFGGDALVFMPALLVSFAPKDVGDSLISNHIVFNSARKFIIKKTGRRKLLMGSSVMGIFTIFLNKDGRIQSVNGIGTSFNIKGTAGPFLNMDSVITASLGQRRQHMRLAIINKLDSVETTINTTQIKIIYSRPSVRNRVIFGEVVPWNRVWRTGADAATKILLRNQIYFDGKKLPAGNYSIFTLPTPTGWTLIFNKQADIWGTEHDAAYDFLMVPMQTQPLDRPIELLTLAVVPAGSNGGVISISWNRLKAFADFTTQP